MISRWFISILLIAAAASMSPWKLICDSGCQERCCGSSSTDGTASSCCPPATSKREPSSSGATCCEPTAAVECGACCGSKCTAECLATTDAVPACCLFVPIHPCTGCDLLRLCLWAPWKGTTSDEARAYLHFVSAQVAIQIVALPRAQAVLPTHAPERPPWTPCVGEFLSRICLLTI